ncbi:aspartic proteinase nepenthesin-1-like [Cryptomeria japonica]|uniref:aspartic proteinase nepenthesin-1-like n=1 Tax=Cryptomeria japonica TaxID=3369 RepID=UPI0027DA677E|nr:aspartic proteinase nepenthesin-1-like [Cryptomeria japonica]
MDCSKLLGFVVLICFTIPMISCSSDRLFSAWPKSSSDESIKIRVNMTRRSERELSIPERLRSAVDRSKERMKKIEAFAKQKIRGQLDAETPVEVGDGEFLMSVAVGTPPVSFEAIVDTGSDLIWTQCKPCQNCYTQPTPIFDPSKSSTFSRVPCGAPLCDALGNTQTGCKPHCTFMYEYGDGSFTSGDLAFETLSIGSDSEVAGIAFGCGNHNEGQGFSQGGGLVGLGRGDLSLISQLGSKAENKFSYCLLSITDSSSQTSPLFFGEGASLSGAKTMPLIKSSIIPTFWYIPITGITLNGKALDIPPGTFDLQSDGNGGMIIDSGTTITYLDEPAYSPMKKAIQSAIDLTPVDGSSTGLDLCYGTSSSDVILPTLVFNFKGGVDYELPADNVFIQISENLLCLAMLGKPSGNGFPSIFGNIQQQNFHILYDNAHNTLSFKPAKCDSL